MSNHAKFLMALMIAALTLGVGVGSASALRSISITETTVSASGRVTFETPEGGVKVECNTTITRTVSRFIPKTEGILLGRVTRIDRALGEAGCRASLGSLQDIIILGLEREENCRLFFKSISGTLPDITAINKIIKGCLIGFSTRILFIGTISCLYKEDGRGIEVTENVTERRTRTLRTATIGENKAIILEGQNSNCPREGKLRGTLTSARPPTIQLI